MYLVHWKVNSARWQVLPYTMVHQYTEGTLVVDVIDRGENQVIWHGKTSDVAYEDMPDVEKKIAFTLIEEWSVKRRILLLELIQR